MLPLVEVQTADFPVKPINSTQSRVERAIQARRGHAAKHADAGHTIGYTSSAAQNKVHIIGSVVSQLMAGADLRDGIREEFIRYNKIAAKGRRNIIFVVDTSGSMLSEMRLAMVKGAVVSLLKDAYIARTQVALVGFGGTRAEIMLPFTSSPELAATRIDSMKGGGTTPLVEALSLASNLIEEVAGEPIDVIVLSDGRYNRSKVASPEQAIGRFAAYCHTRNVHIVLVDAGAGNKTAQRRAMRLAHMLHAEYKSLTSMRADAFVQALE